MPGRDRIECILQVSSRKAWPSYLKCRHITLCAPANSNEDEPKLIIRSGRFGLLQLIQNGGARDVFIEQLDLVGGKAPFDQQTFRLQSNAVELRCIFRGASQPRDNKRTRCRATKTRKT